MLSEWEHWHPFDVQPTLNYICAKPVQLCHTTTSKAKLAGFATLPSFYSLSYLLPPFPPLPILQNTLFLFSLWALLYTVLFLSIKSAPSFLFLLLLLSSVGDIGFLGGSTVAVLASVRRTGTLPATEHHSGNQSHAAGFISNQPVSWCSLWA